MPPYRINQYPTPPVCRITSQTSYPTPNTVLEIQVYLSQVLHLFKMSFIDGVPVTGTPVISRTEILVILHNCLFHGGKNLVG